MPGGASLARAYGFCRPGKAKPPPGTAMLTLRGRFPERLFLQFLGGFVFQYRPDHYRTHQVEDGQHGEQRAKADGVCQGTHYQRKQRTCSPCRHPGQAV